MKRVFDVVIALLGLIVCAPAMLGIGCAILLTMGRPVFSRQLRGGKNGVPFELLKFRTMRPGTGSDASRVTPLGRRLRLSSLDELPELWNVVRGEMSLVGPRPLVAEYLPAYSERQRRRHEVHPGITGLAQVDGRNELSWDTRFERDVYYVEHHSFRLDLEILRRTVGVVLTARGSTAVEQPAFKPSRPTENVSPPPMDGYAECADRSTGVAGS